jgi:hypothetical protein
MPSADNMSLAGYVCANAHLAALAVASLAFAVPGTVSAADPPVTAEYRSALAGYRHFDAEAPAVDWRETNDAIRDGAEGGAHGMHEMRPPIESRPATGDAPPPATPAEPQAHPQ